MLELEHIYKELSAKDVQDNIKKTLAEISANIEDQTTHATNVRALNIAIRIYPNTEREQVEIEIDVSGKLAKRITVPRIGTVGKHIPLPMDPKQPTLDELAERKNKKKSKKE